MSSIEDPFAEILTILEKELELYLEEAPDVESDDDALNMVTEEIGINSYIEDTEEIYFEEEHASISKEKIPFGENYPDIKEFKEKAMSSDDPVLKKLFEHVRFVEESWTLDVSPHCGSITICAIKMVYEKEESPYYESQDLRDISDNTFGPMW